MGVMDHRRTWRYRVNATPDQCVEAFARAFSGKGGMLVKAEWHVQRSHRSATATYQGRRGFATLVTAFSQRSQDEEATAVGSEVQFEVEEAGEAETQCAMWLGTRGTKLGFTADGRFFRPYMRAVEAHLRELDAGVLVAKD